MAAPQPNQPALTPQFCFSTVVLRDFLRASRAIDDTITQHLNALVTPSRAGFDPASTAHRTGFPSSSFSSSPASSSSSASSTPSQPACRAFRDELLFPAWQARDDVIRYCAGVADEAVAKDAQAQEASASAAAAAAFAAATGTLNSGKPAAEVTERLDPYIKRRQFSLVEPQANLLASLMRNEQGVETIVRARSWDVLQSRCGSSVVTAGPGEPGWEAALERWRKREGR
ncbi:hypothetical protein SCUCBS95973_005663 [Sporothrix curviconia]|uniref:Caffeine-induced death protein 2 n=1 Tax=Sporothrix curviconia TaxID=1260050 RepID=A0ABP0BYQ1_9PEZI